MNGKSEEAVNEAIQNLAKEIEMTSFENVADVFLAIFAADAINSLEKSLNSSASRKALDKLSQPKL